MQTEREDGEKSSGSVISVDESVSRKSRRNDMRSISHSHQTPHESEDLVHLREHLERRARQAILGENSAQRKLYSTEYDMEINNLERRNSEFALCGSQRELESQRLQVQQASQWNIMFNEKELICVPSRSERIVFIKRATQEVVNKLKN